MSQFSRMDIRIGGVRAGRIVTGLSVAVFQLVTYQLLLQYNADRLGSGSLWNIETAFDRALPLIPEFAFVYFLYIPGLIIPALLDMPMTLFLRYAVAMVLAVCVSSAGFAWIPLQVIHEPFVCTRFSCEGLVLLREVDPGVNLMPSLHASQTLLAAMVLYFASSRYQVRSFWWQWSACLYVPIIISTLVTKQHYVLDLLAGFGVAIAAWWLSGRLFHPVARHAD